jgi:hypothetical protein
LVHPRLGMQCVTERVKPVLTSTTRIRLPLQCERSRGGYRSHPRWKATLVPSGDHAGEPSIQPFGGWVIWRMWLPLGYIVIMARRRRSCCKTIRPSVEAGPAKLLVLFLCSWPVRRLVEAVSPLVLFLCSWSAPPLAGFPPPQAANNSGEQSPMRRPITSTTRRDGFPISEWSMPLLLLSSLISGADMLTVGAPLSREVGDCFLSCSGNFSRDIFFGGWKVAGPLL